MTEFNITGEWSSGNILFKNASGSEIGYLDGDNTSVVAVGSLVASSSASIAGGATVAGSLVASSSMGVTGGLTVTKTITASSGVTIPYGGFNCPEILGRVDFDITTNATVGVCGGLVNPTTLVLLIEKAYTRITTASSAGNALSLGVVATYTSGSNIADATIATNATGIVGLNSSTPFPVEWSTGYYLVAYKALGSTAIVAKVSAFYTGVVST